MVNLRSSSQAISEKLRNHSQTAKSLSQKGSKVNYISYNALSSEVMRGNQTWRFASIFLEKQDIADSLGLLITLASSHYNSTRSIWSKTIITGNYINRPLYSCVPCILAF